jgi:hypothetical protein
MISGNLKKCANSIGNDIILISSGWCGEAEAPAERRSWRFRRMVCCRLLLKVGKKIFYTQAWENSALSHSDSVSLYANYSQHCNYATKKNPCCIDDFFLHYFSSGLCRGMT